MADETKMIELWSCRYRAPCKVENCRVEATIIARGIDAHGRPIRHYALCQAHADQVAQRELVKGRQVVHRDVR